MHQKVLHDENLRRERAGTHCVRGLNSGRQPQQQAGTKFRRKMSLFGRNDLPKGNHATPLWIVLLFLLLCLFCTPVDSTWCSYTEPQRNETTKNCREAQIDLYTSGWVLDFNRTAVLNGWDNDQNNIINKVEEGNGTCVLYSIIARKVEHCCLGWTGPSCDTPACVPQCVHGTCSAPMTCLCHPPYAGPACDEDPTALTSLLKYCYADQSCHFNKTYLNVTSKAQCCENGGSAWGSHAGEIKVCEPCNMPSGINRVDVIPSSPLQTVSSCMSSMDSLFRTFDGVKYKYRSACAITMIKNSNIHIQSTTECDVFNKCLCIKRVTVQLLDRGIKMVYFNGTLTVFSGDVTVASSVYNISNINATERISGVMDVQKIGDSFYMTLAQYGLSCRLDSEATLYITAERSDRSSLGEIQGFCWNFNEDPTDELMLGADQTRLKPFVSGPCGNLLFNCTTSAEAEEARRYCDSIQSSYFAACRPLVDGDYYMQYCMSSSCSARRQSLEKAKDAACVAISIYAAECARHGVVVSWNTNETACQRKCPANMTYEPCGSPCRRECGKKLSAYVKENCNECVPGCYCSPGLIYNSLTGKCGSLDECSCVYNNRAYQKGQITRTVDQCQICECGSAGLWHCNASRCLATCDITGHGFVKTFDGENFFLGSNGSDCGFNLVCTADSIFINLLTRPCPREPGASDVCIKGIQVGTRKGQLFNIIADENGGGVTVTDVSKALSLALPYYEEPFYLKDVTSNATVVEMVDMRVVFYQLGYVKLETDPVRYFGIPRGLCGNLNSNLNDDRMFENEAQAATDEEFLREFSFMTASSGQSCGRANFISQSSVSEAVCSELRTVHVANDQSGLLHQREVEGVCHSSPTRDNVCPFLFRLSDRLQISFQQLLDSSNSEVSYGSLRSLCSSSSPSCPPGLDYRGGVDVCRTSCRDVLYKSGCNPGVVQGCTCNSTQLRTENGTCANPALCTCYDRVRNRVYQPGETATFGCKRCLCRQGELKCITIDCALEEVICPRGMVVVNNISITDDQCQRPICPINYSIRYGCAEKIYGSGRQCYCPLNMVENHQGECIPQGTCSCYHRSQWHEPGTTIVDGCYEKTCINAVWNVSKQNNCTAECTMVGSETRYVTFDGHSYTFPGACTYVLLQTVNTSNNILITTQNMLCGVEGTSCSRKIEISYLGLVISLIRGRGIQVGDRNYTDDEDVYIANGLVKIYPTSLFTVIEMDELVLMWSHSLIVAIRASNKWMGKFTGLCGNFDLNSNNDMVTRTGVAASTALEFGNSWKLPGKPCSDVTEDHLVNPCQSEPRREEWSRKSCEFIISAEESRPCRQALTEAEVRRFYDDCVKDGCACNTGGDCECLCDSIAAFMKRCGQFGLCLSWRNHRRCPIMCDSGKHYSACGSPIQPTCDNPYPNMGPGNFSSVVGLVEGCFCDKDYVLHGNKCIPLDKCPCEMDGQSYQEGTTIVQYCQNCTCRNRTFECVGESCKVNCTGPQVFKCQSDEQCIPAEYRCDGMWDCVDASDEKNCEENNCTDSFFACRTDPMTRKCIPEHYVCDGIPNCADGSDEDPDICRGNCTVYQYRCQSGFCIDRDFVCDHDFDCADGDDELRCEDCHKCVRNCTEFDFYCSRDTCISINFTCDGVDDCGDGSDEMGCLTSPPLSTECVPDSQWGPWGPCLPSGNGTKTRELICESCCEDFVQRNETTRCFECQCHVTLEAANDALHPAGIILASGDELGSIKGGNTILIDDDGVYLESGLIIDIAPCIECECTQPNCTFTCRLDTCLTTTPIALITTTTTTPTITTPITTTTPPDCWTPWSQWTSCRFKECSTSTRNRTCTTSSPACNCSTPFEQQYKDCPCSTTIQPYTTTVCTRGCRNICEDTCRHYNSNDCIYTTPEQHIYCPCKRCPEGFKEDETGRCVRVEDCPCYHNGTYYPVGFQITYPERCEICACDSGGVYSCSRKPDCCMYGEWGPWGDCSVGCGIGTRSRRKASLSPECAQFEVEDQPCSSICQCGMNGNEYPVDLRMSPCYTCDCINGQCTTVWSPEGNATWSEWSPWTVCEGEANCRDHKRSRCRSCHNSCGFGGCLGPAMEEEPCNSSPCCSNYMWSEWSLCSTTCGLGNQVRQKRFRDNATASDCVNTNTEQVQACGNPGCSCDSIGSPEWSAWSECRSPNNDSCGHGTQSRERTLPPCEGIVTRQEQPCFIANCECAAGLVYSNHSTCHPVCNQPVDPLCNLTVQAACVCPMGQHYDMHSGDCVTKDVCDQCKYGNRTYKPGDEWECGQCSVCSCCGSGQVNVKPKQCPNVSTCDLTTHKLVPSASPCCSIDCVPKRCEVHVGPPINVTVGDCVSVHPVPNQYCSGDCPPSWQGVDYVLSTLKNKECTCCSAHEISYDNIILACPDGTRKQHSIPKLKSCKCGPSVCTRGQQ